MTCTSRRRKELSMEIHQLRCFVCAAEHRSISGAAKKLLISQPTLSRVLKSLEEDLNGIQLFLRTNNGIELTEAGKVLLEDARKIIAEEERTRDEIISFHSGTEGPIRLVSRCIRRLMYESVEAFMKKYPDTKFYTLQNDDLAIYNLQYDLMISSDIESRERTCSQKLFTERFLCAVSKDSHLTRKNSLSLSEFASLPQIAFGGQRHVAITVREKLKSLGLKYHVIMRCDDSTTACHFVSSGLGALLVPEYTLSPELLDKVCLLPVSGLNLTREVYLSWLSNHYLSPAAKRYRSFLLQFLSGDHIQK